MAYDRTKEQTLVISKEAHAKLKELAQLDDRTLRSFTERLIEYTYNLNPHTKKTS